MQIQILRSEKQRFGYFQQWIKMKILDQPNQVIKDTHWIIVKRGNVLLKLQPSGCCLDLSILKPK